MKKNQVVVLSLASLVLLGSHLEARAKDDNSQITVGAVEIASIPTVGVLRFASELEKERILNQVPVVQQARKALNDNKSNIPKARASLQDYINQYSGRVEQIRERLGMGISHQEAVAYPLNVGSTDYATYNVGLSTSQRQAWQREVNTYDETVRRKKSSIAYLEGLTPKLKKDLKTVKANVLASLKMGGTAKGAVSPELAKRFAKVRTIGTAITSVGVPVAIGLAADGTLRLHDVSQGVDPGFSPLGDEAKKAFDGLHSKEKVTLGSSDGAIQSTASSGQNAGNPQ